MQFDATNYINTWNNSSVLQGQFPDVNDYVDLFRSSYTPSTSSTSSTPSTSSESGVGSLMEPKIINTDDSGDQGNPPGGNTNTGYGYSEPGGFDINNIGEGTVAAGDMTFGMKVDDAITGAKATFNNIGPSARAIGSGLLSFMTKSKFSPIGVIKSGYDFAKENVNRIQEEKAAAAAAAAAKAQQIKDYGDYGEAGGSYGGQGNTGTEPGDFHSDDYDMKDGGRVGFAEGGSYWQTVQEAYDSAGGEDGTGLGFFDFADMYFPNPMADGGIVSLAGGGGVGMPPIAASYPIIDTPDQNLTTGVLPNLNPFINYTKQFDAFGGEGEMGVYKERGQDPSFGIQYRKQFEPGGGINSLFRKK